MIKKISDIIERKVKPQLLSVKFLFFVYIIIVLIAGTAEYFHGAKVSNGIEYTHYENYIIFKNAFHHLESEQDLYSSYPQEAWDIYKYSPTFAALMSPFSILPDFVGLNLWNLLNGLLLFAAIWFMPGMDKKKKIFMLWFILLELLTSIQNSQSNGLMAALMILTFNAFENKKQFLAALFICLSIYLKLFGGVLIFMMFFYEERKKFALYFLIWMAVLLLLPLLFVPFEQLVFLYKSWYGLLSADHSSSIGLSVMGWLYTWFGLAVSKSGLLLIGIVLLLAPLIFINKYNSWRNRIFFLASCLIWVVIFNHKAESPTFIIAVSGIAVWYFGQVRVRLNFYLLILAFILISLSPTDIFPSFLRKNFVVPYVLKAVPAIIIWGMLQLFFYKQIKFPLSWFQRS